MKRSNYKYTIDGNIIFIEDLNLGSISVTNDIENVISDISKEMNTSMDNFKVIYKDSDGVIDGIVTDKGMFDKFYYIGEDDYYAAKLKI